MIGLRERLVDGRLGGVLERRHDREHHAGVAMRDVVEHVQDEDIFLANYGDVLTDAPLDELVEDFRGRNKLRPYYDLIANIAAEEYGHVEAVGATITVRTDAAASATANAARADREGLVMLIR